MIKVNISNAQAKEIAYCIFTDIKSYISEHKEEYEKFSLQLFLKTNIKSKGVGK